MGEPVVEIQSHQRLPYHWEAGSLASRFFSGVKRGRIYGVRCPSCRSVIVPPSGVCARCWTQTTGWVPLPDSGVVASFAVVHTPFYGQEVKPPYVLANILLDNADTLFLHLLQEVEPREVRIGMRVQAVWTMGERTGYLNDDVRYFRPTGEPDMPPERFMGKL